MKEGESGRGGDGEWKKVGSVEVNFGGEEVMGRWVGGEGEKGVKLH